MGKPSRGTKPALSLRGRAIQLLAQREHSRTELARKLSQPRRGRPTPASLTDADESPPASAEDIERLLDQLEENGLLSDARAAAAYVRGHATRFGAAKLIHSLRTRGIDDALITTSLAQEEIEDEPTRAAALWHSKFGHAPRDIREWARQARFLQGRGFSGEVIRRLLKDMNDLPQDAGSDGEVRD